MKLQQLSSLGRGEITAITGHGHPYLWDLGRLGQRQVVSSSMVSKQLRAVITTISHSSHLEEPNCYCLLPFKAFDLCLGISILKFCSLHTCHVIPL